MENLTELRQIADRIGLGEYAPALEAVYEAQKGKIGPACDLELIDRLQEKYDLFGEYFELVKQSAEEINADPDLNIWVNATAQYQKENTKGKSCRLPMPEMSDSVAKNFMMLHVMMPMIIDAFAAMEKRGFSWDELEDARSAYKSAIKNVELRTGKPGINRGYFSWLNLYCRALIFKVAGFWFEVRKFPADALWLRNRETKQIIPLVEGTFHRDCTMHLNAKNFKDPDGSFVAEIAEDEDNFYGHACVNNIIDRQWKKYPKTLWELAGGADDYCLGMHIPRGTDVSTEATMRACEMALQLVRERFPEYGVGNGVFCRSWLLNPRLAEIQGPQSRITQFEECFTKYPNRDGGDGIFSFVFIKKPENLEDLPEDTSLQRKLKKMYLEGDCIHAYSGAIFVE